MQEDDEDGTVDDIESSIQKEVASMGKMGSSAPLFAPVWLDLQCVLFFKTRPPIDPVDFVHKICDEVATTQGIRRMRYVNRLSPMTLIGKATEKGLEETGRAVLGTHFNLRQDAQPAAANEGKELMDLKPQLLASHSVSGKQSVAMPFGQVGLHLVLIRKSLTTWN